MKKLKRFGMICCFSMVLAYVLVAVNEVVRYKEPYGIVQYEGFYEQEKNTVDVLFLGTSHVYSNIDPAYIYDETGILSYDLATGGAEIRSTYYSFKQALKYQKPKVVVVEIFGAVRDDDHQMQQREIVDATYKLKDPLIKYEALKAVCDDTENSVLEFWLAFPWYHTLYSDINRFDFSDYSNTICFNGNKYTYLYPKGNLKAYKGATTLLTTAPCEQIVDARSIVDENPLTEKADEYIRKIIELAQKNNISICFLSSPFQALTEEMQRKINYIKNTICSERGCEFIDANCYIEEFGIDWTSDAGDAGHLNYKGSNKYSRWLSKILSSKYELENKKGAEEAVSWDDNLKWQYEFFAAKDLSEITDFTNYIDRLAEENYMAFILFRGNDYRNCGSLLVNDVNVDGYVMDGGQQFIHHVGEPDLYLEDEKDYFKLVTGTAGSGIYHNGQIIANKNGEGIEIVVYDKWLNNIVDTVFFIGSELTAIR